MAALLLIGLLGVLGALALGATLGVVRRPRVVVALHEQPEVAAIHRTARFWRVAGALAAVAAGAVVISAPVGLGRPAALLPAACGLALVAATAVGELLAPRRRGPVRTAVLERRSLGAVVPRGSAWLAGAGASVLTGLLVLGWSLGSADDAGRAGRVLAAQCLGPDGAVQRASSRGPWPGECYALPMLIALGVLGLVSLAALAAVVRRARPSAEGAGLDRLLRRASARHVLAALSVTAWGTAAPVALLMTGPLSGLDACPPGWFGPAAIGTLAIGVVSLVAATWSLVTLLSGPRLTVDARTGGPVGLRR
ncbi:hypothetical protein GCM10027425_33070 [Alteromonas gracilis]